MNLTPLYSPSFDLPIQGVTRSLNYSICEKNNSETFLLEHDGKTYEIQKYCPHAMGNLSKGRIIDNCIVCPNHGWTFSLVDGSSSYNNASIKIKTVDKEKRTK